MTFAEARRHVNKLCLAAGVPLVESGTAGYFGQVQPILKVFIPQYTARNRKETLRWWP